MNEHQKYLMQEYAKYLKEQTILTPSGVFPIAQNPNKRAEQSYDFQKLVICPFCLIPHQANKFIIREKNKYSGKCPECKQEVHFKTLFDMLKWTGSDFADFVFSYALRGFWKKIYPCFHDWKQKLIFLGMSTSFWERYKNLKGQYGESEE